MRYSSSSTILCLGADLAHLRESEHELSLPLGGGGNRDASLGHLRRVGHRHLFERKRATGGAQQASRFYIFISAGTGRKSEVTRGWRPTTHYNRVEQQLRGKRLRQTSNVNEGSPEKQLRCVFPGARNNETTKPANPSHGRHLGMGRTYRLAERF